MTTGIATSTAAPPAHSSAYVESILAQLDRLPTLKPVAMRLLRATTSEETSARDVVTIIRGDASLSSALLRALHRADLGVRRDVTDIERAVTLLGFTAVRNLVLAVSVFEAMSIADAEAAAVSRRKALGTHNVAVACAAEMLAASSNEKTSTGDAFICGLLHDVGKIALDTCFPKSYARAMDRVERKHRCICDAERDVFGLDHTIAGKRLLSHWGVGQVAVECAWLHHEPCDALPSSVTDAHLIGLIHLADALVRQHGLGFSGYAGGVNLARAASDVGVSEDALTDAIRQLPARMAPLTDALGLDDASAAMSTDSLLSANRQLGSMNAALAESNRTLERRAHVLECVERFTQQADSARNLGALAAVAARAVLETFGAESAFVVVPGDGGSSAFVGQSSADRAEPDDRLIDGGPLIELVRARDGFQVGDTVALTSAPERWTAALQSIWPGLAAAGACSLFPLRAVKETVGVALIAMNNTPTMTGRVAADELGAPSRVIGQALRNMRERDAAERMTEQLVDLNRRFRQAQAEVLRGKSVSMIAKMADGAAHELNNPLSVISGRAQLALADCKDADLRNALEIIIEQTKRAAAIATDLMDFAKPEPPDPIEQSLASLLEPLFQHWREGLGRTDDWLHLALSDRDASVFVDPAQLRSALEAVVRNAVEAGADRDLRVEINSPSRSSDETVRLSVRDNGPGMTRDVLEHALDPFFSHRPAGRGRGLGLSRAHRLIELNGGRLWLESIPNLGTTVAIELPARAPQA